MTRRGLALAFGFFAGTAVLAAGIGSGSGPAVSTRSIGSGSGPASALDAGSLRGDDVVEDSGL